jgi:hypothetical protein
LIEKCGMESWCVAYGKGDGDEGGDWERKEREETRFCYIVRYCIDVGVDVREVAFWAWAAGWEEESGRAGSGGRIGEREGWDGV